MKLKATTHLKNFDVNLNKFKNIFSNFKISYLYSFRLIIDCNNVFLICEG